MRYAVLSTILAAGNNSSLSVLSSLLRAAAVNQMMQSIICLVTGAYEGMPLRRSVAAALPKIMPLTLPTCSIKELASTAFLCR